MKGRLFSAAIFRFRNIGIFLLSLGLSVLITDPSALLMLGNGIPTVPQIIAYPACLVLYVVLVMQTLLSKQFHDEFNHNEKIRQIRELDRLSIKLTNEAKKNTNASYLQKLKKIIDDKNDIVKSFFDGERSFLKEKIVEQTLNLVVAYIRLLNNFCIRSRELSGVDVGTVAARINNNARKLNFTKDAHMADDIKKIIEIDEKLINRLKEEKKDLERISAKLDYMESTVNMFKHQVNSQIESEEMLEKLETAVNEAEALDNVLEGRRKNKIR